jgi:CorA-like Mg2+ transporter protein
MKKVTSWAAIVAVPTLITGYYGMNVPYPGFGRHWGVIGRAPSWGSFHRAVPVVPPSRVAVADAD